MDVLIDANVIINFITGRSDPFQKTSEQVMSLCSQGRLNGYVAFHSLSIVWYVIRKSYSDAEARYWLGIACKILNVAAATREQVMEAIADTAFRDFEDCLQDKCAQNVGAEYLVTCNARDFRHAKTRAVTPDEMLAILGA
jgi:predicted nucleic acid-binding protein